MQLPCKIGFALGSVKDEKLAHCMSLNPFQKHGFRGCAEGMVNVRGSAGLLCQQWILHPQPPFEPDAAALPVVG